NISPSLGKTCNSRGVFTTLLLFPHFSIPFFRFKSTQSNLSIKKHSHQPVVIFPFANRIDSLVQKLTASSSLRFYTF
ncbi:hypothetical protein, partial [Bartonella sp. MR168JLCBS]|uniref:hypothetical protein n=1 Tax=Bartonella sp. MR168JLCBS TaxID=3243556 RepID=UPI0035CF13F9